MSENNITLIATGTPNPEGISEMQEYIAAAGPIFASHGAEIVVPQGHGGAFHSVSGGQVLCWRRAG